MRQYDDYNSFLNHKLINNENIEERLNDINEKQYLSVKDRNEIIKIKDCSEIPEVLEVLEKIKLENGKKSRIKIKKIKKTDEKLKVESIKINDSIDTKNIDTDSDEDLKIENYNCNKNLVIYSTDKKIRREFYRNKNFED